MTGVDTGWQWWGGVNEDICIYGPCDTKEGVIEEAVADRRGEFQDEDGNWKVGFHIREARKDPLRLSEYLPDILGYAEESVECGEYDEGPYFECTKDQQDDLEKRIKAACDEWQEAHELVFNTFTFSATRNHEYVELPLDTPAQTD